MKKLIIAVLFLVSTSAFAETWTLVNSEATSQGWVCTYQLQGTNYQTTIFNGWESCRYVISN